MGVMKRVYEKAFPRASFTLLFSKTIDISLVDRNLLSVVKIGQNRVLFAKDLSCTV